MVPSRSGVVNKARSPRYRFLEGGIRRVQKPHINDTPNIRILVGVRYPIEKHSGTVVIPYNPSHPAGAVKIVHGVVSTRVVVVEIHPGVPAVGV